MTNEMLYQKVLKRLGVAEQELRSSCRRQGLVDARCLMAAALMKQPLMTQKVVARIMGTNQGTVSKMLTRHESLMTVDATYRMKWDKINN